ncbi:hypothetical protein Tco_0481754 [Tanacetum coccineum]
MNDLNITMEEYIRLEEEKAQKRGKVFNWETAKYGKFWYDEDIHDLRSIETEFPAIAFNDGVSSEKTLSCEPTVSSLNDEIDFRISFDDSDDEDYTIIFDKNSFSYKIISTNDLKTDSENDNEKFNLPSLLSPEPTVSCFDDLYFFKDFENEFPAIVYNNAQMSKSDLLTESILSPQHIDEFDLNDETSVSKYNEEEQNVLYFNDLFSFNIIHPGDLKSEKDNDGNEIDIIQSLGDMALSPRDQRHQYLRYERLQYTDADILDFESRLTRIYRREVHRVQVFDFGGLPNLMVEGLSARMLIEHRNAQGFQLGGVRRRMSWREFILALGLYTVEEMQTVGFGAYWAESARQIPDKGDLRDYWIGILSAEDFLGTSLSYTAIRDLILRLCHRLIACSIAGRSQALEKVTVTDLFYLRGIDVGSVNVPYLLAMYLRLFAAGRKSEAHIFSGLTVIAPKLQIINMAELVRLQICMEVDDTWAWVAMGLERQPDAMAGATRAPQQPPPPPSAARTMPQRLGRLEEEVQGLRRDIGSLRGLVERSMTDQGRFSTWMISCMAQLMKARPRERNIDEYWWRIYKSGDLEVLES